MVTQTRKRVVALSGITGKYRSTDLLTGNPVTSSDTSVVYSHTQSTTSTGHKWPPPSGASRPADSGGAFSTTKYGQRPGGEVTVDVIGGTPGGLKRHYEGPILAKYGITTLLLPLPVLASNASMNAWGTTGISRSSPTNPLSGMGQFIGELRDLPKIPILLTMEKRAKEFKSLARNGSDEYLNIAFGWLPFVKDLTDFFKVVGQSDARISHFIENSGKPIRRRIDIINTSVSTISDEGSTYGFPALDGWMYIGPGKMTKTTTTDQHTYFSGAFTYHVEAGNSYFSIFRRNEQILSHLYGLRITPHLLWQLAPWSWAVDWMSNVGDVVHNLSQFANDGLVLRHGYVMNELSTTVVYSASGIKLWNGHTISPTSTFFSKSKQRTRGTPFGFGLNPSSFDARKWAIVAALGISKAPRSLEF